MDCTAMAKLFHTNSLTLMKFYQLPHSSWFLVWLTFQLWTWRRYVHPKCQVPFTGLHISISQEGRTLHKVKLFLCWPNLRTEPLVSDYTKHNSSLQFALHISAFSVSFFSGCNLIGIVFKFCDFFVNCNAVPQCAVESQFHDPWTCLYLMQQPWS
jgi:hypothetical protein